MPCLLVDNHLRCVVASSRTSSTNNPTAACLSIQFNRPTRGHFIHMHAQAPAGINRANAKASRVAGAGGPAAAFLQITYRPQLPRASIPPAFLASSCFQHPSPRRVRTTRPAPRADDSPARAARGVGGSAA